ncbi:MAG: response regulator [Merismopediaceae bacterium]|nr:response regulator [Merismopediaceae bacterium]
MESVTPLILIVDDDHSLRTLLKLALGREGYRTEEASNGQDALSQFERIQPDIVLLDAMMPEMDGFSCCQQLRQSAQGATTPVLMITFLDDQESVDQAFAAGATDFITKPIHWGVLSQRVQRLLDAQRAIALAQTYQQQLTDLQNWENLIQETLQQVTQSRATLPLLQSLLKTTQTLLQGDRLVLHYPPKKIFLEVSPALPSLRSLPFETLALLDDYESQYLTGQAVLLDSSLTEPNGAKLLQTLNCQAIAQVPLIKEEQVRGLLSLQSQQPRSWSTTDINRLTLIASLMALILRPS